MADPSGPSGPSAGPPAAGPPGAEPADLDALTFEELLEHLEDLTAQLASGEVGIEAAADLYEQAGLVYEAARARLDAVQARIAKLDAGPAASAE